MLNIVCHVCHHKVGNDVSIRAVAGENAHYFGATLVDYEEIVLVLLELAALLA